MPFLRYMCLSAYNGFQHIVCCVFALFVSVMCTLCCQFLWIVHFWLPLRYSLTFIYSINLFISSHPMQSKSSLSYYTFSRRMVWNRQVKQCALHTQLPLFRTYLFHLIPLQGIRSLRLDISSHIVYPLLWDCIKMWW